MSGAVAALAGMTYSRPVFLAPTILSLSIDYFIPAVTTFNIKSDGTYESLGNSISASGNWLLSGAASSYEVRFTPTSGAVSFGSAATATWLTLSSDRSWNKQSGGGFEEVIGVLEIRNASTQQLLVTSTLTLQAIGPT